MITNTSGEAVISVIIPTYQRDYCLAQSLPYIISQDEVSEIIVVDDAGIDHTKALIAEFEKKNPKLCWKYIRFDSNQGATVARMRGLQEAVNSYVAFCDDDDLMMPGYFKQCLQCLKSGAGIVSGRHFYRRLGESCDQAVNRFSSDATAGPYIFSYSIMINKEMRQTEILSVPFTHGLVVTTLEIAKKYLVKNPYVKGNGFREETDFQLRAFADGVIIKVLPTIYAVGMNRKEVKTGGQRVSRISRFIWTIRHNREFLKQHWPVLKTFLNKPYSWKIAQCLFSAVLVHQFFIAPFYILPARGFRWLQHHVKGIS